MKMNLKKSLQLQIFSILLMLVPFVEGRIHTEREKVCMVLSALGLLALIVLRTKFWNCPHCGKNLGALYEPLSNCPNCGHTIGPED